MTSTVAISEQAFRDLRTFSSAAIPFEAGGVLLGLIADGRPWVTMVVRISPRHPHRYRFRIPEGATPAIVAEHRVSDPRLGYLGDWHSHTADLPASMMDRSTLIKIAADRQSGLKRPLLIVVRLVADSWMADIYETRGKNHVPCVPILTGPLPQAPAYIPVQASEPSSDVVGSASGAPRGT